MQHWSSTAEGTCQTARRLEIWSGQQDRREKRQIYKPRSTCESPLFYETNVLCHCAEMFVKGSLASGSACVLCCWIVVPAPKLVQNMSYVFHALLLCAYGHRFKLKTHTRYLCSSLGLYHPLCRFQPRTPYLPVISVHTLVAATLRKDREGNVSSVLRV
jgi:hypothetical protein